MRSLPRTVLALGLLVASTLPAFAATRLYVMSGLNLTELDPTTGAVIGAVPVTGLPTGSVIAALAFDRNTNTLFASNVLTDDIWTIDYQTGAATLVGPLALTTSVLLHGLAVDNTGQLYGYSPNLAMGARFFSINRTTGQGTPISDPGINSFGSLEFVASTNTMYWSNTINDSLYTIDRTTGAVSLVGPFGVLGQVAAGMAYDAFYGMYATNNQGTIGLYGIDVTTGAATLIAALAFNPIALTFVQEPSTPSTSFCSGDAVGTSCLGCGNNGAAGRGCANSSFAGGALLASSGLASIGGDTLVLTASDVPGPGLFFQASGLAASPITFGDGMLCASVAIVRMGVVFPTAGSASYPGGLTPAPISSFGATAGTTLHYQCWYRDAAAFCTSATFNTSNGVSLLWGP